MVAAMLSEDRDTRIDSKEIKYRELSNLFYNNAVNNYTYETIFKAKDNRPTYQIYKEELSVRIKEKVVARKKAKNLVFPLKFFKKESEENLSTELNPPAMRRVQTLLQELSTGRKNLTVNSIDDVIEVVLNTIIDLITNNKS